METQTNGHAEKPTPMPPGFTATGVEADESPQIDQLADALAKAQGEIANATKSISGARGKYADLAAVWDACRGPLSKNGLAIAQRVTTAGKEVIVTTVLLHKSGQFMRDRLSVEVAASNGLTWVQAMGSAVTYLRRYALSALVGVAAEKEDDDGNSATGTDAPQERQQAPRSSGGSRTEQVKQQISQNQKPAEPHPWQLIKGACIAAGYTEEKAKSFVKGVTGKESAGALTMDDVAKVKEVLANMPAPAAETKKLITDVAEGETEEQAKAREGKA